MQSVEIGAVSYVSGEGRGWRGGGVGERGSRHPRQTFYGGVSSPAPGNMRAFKDVQGPHHVDVHVRNIYAHFFNMINLYILLMFVPLDYIERKVWGLQAYPFPKPGSSVTYVMCI